MKTSLYAIHVRAGQIVAAEVPADTAAILLDAGRSILLATEPDLSRLARRLDRSLAIFARKSSPRSNQDEIPSAPRRSQDGAFFNPLSSVKNRIGRVMVEPVPAVELRTGR